MLPRINFTAAHKGIWTKSAPKPDAFHSAIKRIGIPIMFESNAEIYVEEDPAENFYQVVSGTVRSYKLLDDGRRQIGAFYFPGDIFGLEVDREYSLSAEAIGDARVLLINRNSFIALAARDNKIARQLWALIATELHRQQGHSTVFIMNARERVIDFLHEMAKRSPTRSEIDLPMSRGDIADYLGLTTETISRTLKQLERSASIALPTSRHIVLRDCIGARPSTSRVYSAGMRPAPPPPLPTA